jgi:hypothetical protein
MRIWIRGWIACVAVAFAFGVASPAFAQPKKPSVPKKKIEGCLQGYDANTKRMVIRDRHSGKEEDFRVKQATSVLDKEGTVATLEGRKAQLTDLLVNRPIIAYWIPDPQDAKGKFLSKADGQDGLDDSGQLDADAMEVAGCKMQ